MFRSRHRALTAVYAVSLLLTGCAISQPRQPELSQGDIALCTYIDGLSSSVRLWMERGQTVPNDLDLFEDVTDGQLLGLVALAWGLEAGTQRDAVLDRCRELGAL